MTQARENVPRSLSNNTQKEAANALTNDADGRSTRTYGWLEIHNNHDPGTHPRGVEALYRENGQDVAASYDLPIDKDATL